AALPARLDPAEEGGLELLLALLVIFAGGVVLAVLALVVRDTSVLAGVDRAVADWGDDHGSAASTHGLDVATAFGETWMAVAVGVAVALIDLWRRGNRWTAVFVLVVVGGDKLLTTGLKEVVDRVRPAFNPVAETLGPSFPSGHASTAAALW